MRKTQFAGLTVLEPGEGLDTDNGAFIDRDRNTIDHFLRLGAKLHRHNGLAGLSNPTQAASGSVIASGGTIPSNLTISLGYTLEDSVGGETMISPLAVVSTGPPMDIPPAAPSAAVDYSAGALMADTYYYAITWIDGDGGETPAGPAVSVERGPAPSGQIKLSNLTYGMAAAGAVGWRLFRAIGGGSYDLLTTGSIGTDTFTDNGSAEVNCDLHPPTDSQNNTNSTNTLQVKLPNADSNMSSATFINLYMSLSGDFGEASSLGQYPLASAGKTATFTSLEINDLTPPDVNLSIGGASLIDPDTELLDWHWKRPVAASALLGSGLVGDVRLVTGTGLLYGVLSASASAAPGWSRIGSGLVASGGIAVPDVGELDFIGSGGTSVAVTNLGAGKAGVTITTVPLAVAASGLVLTPVTRLEFASGSIKSTGAGSVLYTPPGPRDWGLVKSLPKGAVRGDRCEFIADESKGIVWQLVFDGEGEFPWKKIGGPPLYDQYTATGNLTTNSATPQTTNAPKVTAPLSMEFLADYGTNTSVGATAQARMTPYVGGVLVSEFAFTAVGGASTVIAPNHGKFRATATKGQIIQARYWSGVEGTNCEFYAPYIAIDPVRVG